MNIEINGNVYAWYLYKFWIFHPFSFAEHRGIISPAIIEHTGTVHVNQDEGAVLLCIAQSCPAPVYKYVKILYC